MNALLRWLSGEPSRAELEHLEANRRQAAELSQVRRRENERAKRLGHLDMLAFRNRVP